MFKKSLLLAFPALKTGLPRKSPSYRKTFLTTLLRILALPILPRVSFGTTLLKNLLILSKKLLLILLCWLQTILCLLILLPIF